MKPCGANFFVVRVTLAHRYGGPMSDSSPEHRWEPTRDVEQRTWVFVAVLVAFAAQFIVPVGFRLNPSWVLPAAAGGLALLLAVGGRAVEDPGHTSLRLLAVAFAAVLAVGNLFAVARLITALLTGSGVNAEILFSVGLAAWVTNIVAFAVVYWELDNGGPVARSRRANLAATDFFFPQYGLASHTNWQPRFIDYLYVSFTNATAFSPTDTLPLRGRAKALMALQSAVALVAVAVVFARGVNILT